jgi:putative hydrolase of the HAD superfamily
VQRRFDAVLFDFGGVYTPSPFAAFERVAAELGVRPARVVEIVFGPYDRDTDHPWHRLERGELGFGEARETIMALAAEEGLELDPLQVLLGMGSERAARAPLVERTRSLRGEGYRTALVTNNAREFRESWRSLLPLEELFDVVVDSSEVGVRKPDPAIFHLALERIGGVAPQRAIFLDDYAGNVEAARRLGMQGVLVGDPAQALAELEHLLAGRDPGGRAR